ncbi:hypothetical protein cpbgf_6001950 [Cryptosporidium parvum]|uniref:ER membrane protein complex subunit 6 n=1 Tax=Cryptosporidium parvum TaxID=5807 RepID=A0A7S7LFB6_CRYPV|nr:hypothetical protein CPATCC_0013450 [Cryptosporidium parvum]WRK32794.1 hypothetical protein cpbgf_6001950 [Cryptosporidium parvum]|eukprot:QOY41075.1 hypothetical protein CPATCC_002718 [Cryptosporidium parvum]
MKNKIKALATSNSSIENNNKVFKQCRLIGTVLFGTLAGILGFKGFSGIMFYIYSLITTLIIIVLKIRINKCNHYFDTFNEVLGIGDYFLSFILFWSISYCICHIYY